MKYLEPSIAGDLKSTIFSQSDNTPTDEDGISLFKILTSFTTVAYLQLSMISFNHVLNFDPSEFNFSIPKVNSNLFNLFLLATTKIRKLLDSERIQHTLNAYTKIKKPEVWAQWVRIQVDKFGTIVKCQAFMNSALVKFNCITGDTESSFKGSSNSIQEDIVTMYATYIDRNKRKAKVPAEGKLGKEASEDR